MIELTTEDRERIEQEAMAHSTLGKNYLGETLYDTKAHSSFKEGAEYATRFERTHILNRIVLAEAERSELIRRIKSILKASTVHDKISILEELEQLLNSLKK